jgi:hypothetical protein
MHARVSPAQLLMLRKAERVAAARAAGQSQGELNVIPFLDIVMNVLMFVLATSATVFTAQIAVPAPTCCASPRPVTRERLTVHATPRGYVVGSRAGFIAPDCASTTSGAALADGVTVPLLAGRHDTAALSACLARLRNASPAWSQALAGQRSITVSTVGTLPYDLLVRTLDATRETRPGAADLFPDAELGVLR